MKNWLPISGGRPNWEEIRRRWLPKVIVANLGGTTALRSVWIAWRGAYDTALSVLPFTEGNDTIERPLDHLVVRLPGRAAPIPAIPRIIETVEHALLDPLNAEEDWDQLEILLARAERNNPWMQSLWLQDRLIEALLWRTLRWTEEALAATLESAERGLPLGQTLRDAVTGLSWAIESSIYSIWMVYNEYSFRYTDETASPQLTDEDKWLLRLLTARWWHEVQRRLPIRGAMDQDNLDIVE